MCSLKVAQTYPTNLIKFQPKSTVLKKRDTTPPPFPLHYFYLKFQPLIHGHSARCAIFLLVFQLTVIYKFYLF